LKNKDEGDEFQIIFIKDYDKIFKTMSNIFRAYDIRGSYPDEINETIAKKIGAAYIDLLAGKNIVIGHDMRLSSPALADAFIQGALFTGASISDIGMVSTPQLYYSIIEGEFDGGVMITASHLPSEINGFKLCWKNAIPFSGDKGLPELENLVMTKKYSFINNRSSDSYHKANFFNQYINRLSSFIHQPRQMKIVVDAGNGMAGDEVLNIFKSCPVWTLIPIYFKPDGRFPHHVANPLIPADTSELQTKTKMEKADIGVAFDGDVDRCGFIDEKGERIPEDLVTALIAQFLLAKNPGATIVYDLRSSRIVPETITSLGGEAIRCRVGHSFIKEAMHQNNALFAGELSGHYYFRDIGFTDNGILAMIYMLNLLSVRKQPLSHLVEPLKKYSATGEININTKNKGKIFSALENHFKDGRKDYLDGLTIEYDNWWFNLRPSNTEPVVRLNLEADEPTLRETQKNMVLKIIKGTDPAMNLVA
jgi:phosphomannomutase